jgi:hypothetical protein
MGKPIGSNAHAHPKGERRVGLEEITVARGPLVDDVLD